VPEVGDILRGRYKLLRTLGRGGTADVYRAMDDERSAEVAIKVLREDYAEEPEFIKRFSKEAQALARLDHPNIVRFYSFEQDGRTAFIVMDYVRGSTLRGRLRDAGGPLPIDETTRILRQVGAALSFAHRRGFLHRDIKSANIMLDEHGRALLSDFGIAKAAEATTTTHSVAGTPAYMSPEQILGHSLDARTDIYSLGIVLYEMVAGRRPFVGDLGTGTTTPARVQDEHLHANPPDPRQFNPGLPADIAGIALRALAKDPNQRWPDVGSLVAAWEAARYQERPAEATAPIQPQGAQVANRGEQMPAPAPELPKAATPRQPRRPAPGVKPAAHRTRLVVPLLGVLGGVSLCCVIALGLVFTTRSSSATPAATSHVLATAQPSSTPHPSATPQPEALGRIAFASDRDGNGEIYVMNADGSGLSRLTNNHNEDGDPTWLPDGSRIAFQSDRDGNAEIYVMNADGSGQTNLTNSLDGDGGAAWSPDGSRIAFESYRDGNVEVYVMNADGSDQTNLSNNAADDWLPAWSPDGSRIAFSSDRDGNWEIYVMNADGSDQTRLTNNQDVDWVPLWSPDGSRIAFNSGHDGKPEVCVMNADGSGQTNLTNNPGVDGDLALLPAWSPDGSRIAFTSDRDGKLEVYIMNADGSGQTNLTNNPGYDGDLAWSPPWPESTGTLTVAASATATSSEQATEVLATAAPEALDRIAFTSGRDGNWEVYVMNADGSVQTNLTNNPGEDVFPAWSADGSRIAFSSDRDGNREVYVMNADGSRQTNLTNNPSDDFYPAWSPDGGRIAFSSNRDGNWEVYVMNADGSVQTNLTNNPGEDVFPAWSADGSRIAFSSDRDGNREVYVMNADGSVQTNLTNTPGDDRAGAWSPDGGRIAFSSNRDGDEEVYVMNADGSVQTNLTNNPGNGGTPAWSPDGSRIAFSSNRDGNYEIYVMNDDGSDQTNLTNNPGDDWAGAWLPK